MDRSRKVWDDASAIAWTIISFDILPAFGNVEGAADLPWMRRAVFIRSFLPEVTYIVDNQEAVQVCRQAAHGYRGSHDITDERAPIDRTGVYRQRIE